MSLRKYTSHRRRYNPDTAYGRKNIEYAGEYYTGMVLLFMGICGLIAIIVALRDIHVQLELAQVYNKPLQGLLITTVIIILFLICCKMYYEWKKIDTNILQGKILADEKLESMEFQNRAYNDSSNDDMLLKISRGIYTVTDKQQLRINKLIKSSLVRTRLKFSILRNQDKPYNVEQNKFIEDARNAKIIITKEVTA